LVPDSLHLHSASVLRPDQGSPLTFRQAASMLYRSWDLPSLGQRSHNFGHRTLPSNTATHKRPR